MQYKFGFPDIWRQWIRVCLCSTSIYVIVNGSPSKQFSVSKGIRQWDPMAPFFFLLVAEGFSGLIRNACSIGLFEGFNMGSQGVEVCHLQFADDTIMVYKLNASNLWCVKSILRCFELV